MDQSNSPKEKQSSPGLGCDSQRNGAQALPRPHSSTTAGLIQSRCELRWINNRDWIPPLTGKGTQEAGAKDTQVREQLGMKQTL